MSSVINLFEQLGSGVTTGGTWTNTQNPGSAPVAPNPYDADIDFDTFPDGTYIYEYEVTAGSCTERAVVTVEWNDAPAADGDECLTATVQPKNPNSTIITDPDTLKSNCPLEAAPTMSAEAIPGAWFDVNTGDIWYNIISSPLPGGGDPQFFVTMTATSGSDMRGPAVAAYSGTCGGLTLINAAQSGTMSTTANLLVTPNLGGMFQDIYIRLAAHTAGEFVVSFSADF